MEKSYIEREALKHVYMGKGKDRLRLATVINELELAPAADVVEVVRCKDCKFLNPAAEANRFYCDWHREAFETSLDEFCSYGERRKRDAVSGVAMAI